MDVPLVDSESSTASPLAVTSSRESSSKSSLHWATMKGTHAVLSISDIDLCLPGRIYCLHPFNFSSGYFQ